VPSAPLALAFSVTLATFIESGRAGAIVSSL
jgi:hypothetical protein